MNVGVSSPDGLRVFVGVAVTVGPVGVGVRVDVAVGVAVATSKHPVEARSARQPSPGKHESVVQRSPSSQTSILQNELQHAPVEAEPVSQVSGNSTMPLPQVGHGARQLPCWAVEQEACAVTFGAGARVPPLIVGGAPTRCPNTIDPLLAPTPEPTADRSPEIRILSLPVT